MLRARRRYLQRLGLADGEWSKLLGSAAPPGGKPAPKPRKKKAKPAPVDAASCRRSGRIKKEKPEYSGIRYDSFFERLAQDSDSDEEGRGATAIKREKKRRRPAGPKRSEEEVEAEREAILANSKNWLARSRQALLRIEGPNTRSTPTTEEEWHAVAVQRWGEQAGPEAGEGAAGAAEGEWSWERFVASRVSTPPKPSPDPLLQVRTLSQPLPPRRLAACCLAQAASAPGYLCSRVADGGCGAALVFTPCWAGVLRARHMAAADGMPPHVARLLLGHQGPLTLPGSLPCLASLAP